MPESTTPLPTTSTGSFRHGVWFVFPVGHSILRVWGSTLSGKERIYVNETLVHERSNFHTSSAHNVSIDGQDYEVVVRVRSLLTGELECRLQQQGKVLDAYVVKLNGFASWSWRRVLLLGLGMGVLIEVSRRLPDWFGWLAIAAAVLYALTRKKDGNRGLTVEKLRV